MLLCCCCLKPLQEQQHSLSELGLEADTQHKSMLLTALPLTVLLCCCCWLMPLQEQQNLSELGMDADTKANAAANSYAMMRARIQQLPQPAFITEVRRAFVFLS